MKATKQTTYSVSQAAKATGIAITTLYSRLQAGKLGKKITSRALNKHEWRISAKELEALKAEKD